MENASEALSMAATILIGMMIIGVFVALFVSFSSSGTKIEAQLAESQLKAFNAKYEVFREANKEGEKTEYNSLVSIYDIISIINFTNQSNHSNYSQTEINAFGTTENHASMPYYVTVQINFTDSIKHKSLKNRIHDLYNGLESYDGKNIEEAPRNILDMMMKNCYYDSTNIPDGTWAEEEDYILRFKCTHIDYSPKTGRVVNIVFEYVEPDWAIKTP